MPYKNKNISRILKYLNNELSDKDRYAFEREMEADPFLMDAVEGYEHMNPTEIDHLLNQLQERMPHNNKKIMPLWLKIAASVFFIIGISTLFFISNNKNSDPLLSKQQELPINKPLEDTLSSASKKTVKKEIDDNIVEENIQDTISSRKITTSRISTQIIKETSVAKLPRNDLNFKKEEIEKDSSLSSDLVQESEFTTEKRNNILIGTIEGDKIKMDKSLYASDLEVDQNVLKDSFIQYSGKVVDENGTPIPGVTIIEEGKPNGTITDTDGKFTLKTSKKESLLSFDFIGFKQKKLLANKDSIGEVVLENETLALDEVVTIGYGTKSKSRVKEKTEEVENNLIPTPLIGIKKFKRKIERSLQLPENFSNKEIRVNIIVSESGEIADIKIITPVNDTFDSDLKAKIKEQGLWETAIINNKPTKGSRLVIFEF